VIIRIVFDKLLIQKIHLHSTFLGRTAEYLYIQTTILINRFNLGCTRLLYGFVYYCKMRWSILLISITPGNVPSKNSFSRFAAMQK